MYRLNEDNHSEWVMTTGDCAFRNSGLMSAKIPASMKSIGDNVFSACSDLPETPGSVIMSGREKNRAAAYETAAR